MIDASGDVVEGYTGACPERSRGNVFGKPYVMTSGGYDNNWMTEDPGATFSVNASNHIKFIQSKIIGLNNKLEKHNYAGLF